MNFFWRARNFSKDNKNWRGRFTDAPMRDIGKMFTDKMFPAVSLGTIALKDQREPRHLRFSRTGETAARRPTTRGHVGRYEQPRQGTAYPSSARARFRTKTSRLNIPL